MTKHTYTMKTIRTVLLIFTLLGAIMPAMADVNFTEKTYFTSSEYDSDAVLDTYYNVQDANGIQLKTSSKKQKNIWLATIDDKTAGYCWSSTAVDTTASNYDNSYIQISSANYDIKKIKILSRSNNTSYASQFILVGWEKESVISSVADYSSYSNIEKGAALQWYTIDLSGMVGIRTIRIYSAIGCDMYVGETNIKRGIESKRRPHIFGIQVGLSSNSTSIGTYGFSAFSSTSALDFTNVTECNAYYADSYAGGTLHLTKAEGVVPANFGLLLCAPKGVTTPVCIPVATAEQAAACSLTPSGNAFVATSAGTYTPAAAADALALGVKNGAAGFYYVGAGVTIPLNKMYLPASKVAGAKSVTLDFGGIDPTGIVNVSDDAATSAPSLRPATDLLGRPCPNPMPGQMYIKDGKVRVK